MELRACPRCNTVMDQAKLKDIEIDRCPTCGSVWLDKGELGKLVHVDGSELSDFVAAGGDQDAPPLSAAVVLNCPACNGRLQTLDFAGHRVDRCDKCKGLLFEREHLESGVEAIRHAWQKKAQG